MGGSLQRITGYSSTSMSSHGCGSILPELNFRLPKLDDVNPQPRTWDGLPVDVLLLTAKVPEFLSCYYFLSQTKDVCKCTVSDLGKVYIGNVCYEKKAKVKVALIRCYEASGGPGGSQSVLQDAVRRLRPKAVICAGLCGGLNKEKSKLGDVVISFKLSTYAHKKVSSGNQIEQRGVITNVTKNMMNLIKNAADGWKAPLKDPEKLEVEVHCDGEMLSGPVLVDDEKLHKELISTYKRAIGLEMEGEGVYAAAHSLGIEWVIIKGISDFADGTKSSTEGWQPFASAMAASVIFHMLKEPGALKEWPHYSSVQNQTSQVSTSQLRSNMQPQENSLQELLQNLNGNSDGQVTYKGRSIAYRTTGKTKLLETDWVFHAEAWDIESKITVSSRYFQKSDDAVRQAILKLIEKLKEKGKIQD